jgi:hypothetical protein
LFCLIFLFGRCNLSYLCNTLNKLCYSIDFTGIEYVSNRYTESVLLQQKYREFEFVDFIQRDLVQYYFGNYDIVYCCNTMFTDELNRILYNKILNECNGFVILFDYNRTLEPYFVKRYTVKTSWQKSVSVYLFYILQ